MTTRFSITKGLRALAVAATPALFLGACMLDAPSTSKEPGFARIQVDLRQNVRTLMKTASADTTFSLDSLIIVLSAEGVADQRYSYPIAGRPDTGSIVVSPKIYQLNPLLNWKATFLTIDTTSMPVLKRDTVHFDTVTFPVYPADTSLVEVTVRPAYSVLRARLLSTNGDSLPNSVMYVRLRVDGIVRDSLPVGGANATLRWIQAVGGSTLHAAGDSGRILRSLNDGALWSEQKFGTEPMVAGSFPSASMGYVMSISGQTYNTTDGGATWDDHGTTADSVNSVFFTSTSTGFAAGQSGGIYKTANNGESWHTLVSNTTQHLNGVSFPSTAVGYVVGNNETILRTENGTAPGGSAPQYGGVIWEPVAGGWFPQTSNVFQNLNDIEFTSDTRGWAFGDGGTILLTVDGGATWDSRASGDADAINISAVSFSSATTGYLVGDGGALRQQNDNEWHWANRTSGTSEDLFDVRMVGLDTMYIVGANGTILRSTNASTTGWPYLTLTPQYVFTDDAWSEPVSGVAVDLNAAHFASSTVGWSVGESGQILKSTNGGASWTSQTITSGAMNGVWATSTSKVVAVGQGGLVARTTNGNAWMPVLNNGGITSPLHDVALANSSDGWAVGDGGTIIHTTDGGANWQTQSSGVTSRLNAVATNGSNRTLAVGESGAVRRISNYNNNSAFGDASNGTTAGKALNGVSFVPGSSTTAFVVGDGGFIAKCSHNNNNNWAQQTSGTTENLLKVHFINASVGYIVGENGTVLTTDDGGTTWELRATGQDENLSGLRVLNANTVVAVGENGLILRTTVGGLGAFTRDIHVVHPVNSALVYAAGDSGTILKTTNAGASWIPQTVPVSSDLKSIAFHDANNGLAVGAGGVILRTTNGGNTWGTISSGTSLDLNSVIMVSPDTAYATGAGVMLKTADGGVTWYEQELPLPFPLLRLHARTKDQVFAVGVFGIILKAVNEGDNWTGGGIKRDLKNVFFIDSSTGWIVGEDEVVLKTVDAGETWFQQHLNNSGGTLYGVHFVSLDTGWVTGDDGLVLKTTDGGSSWSSQYTGQDVSLQYTYFRNSSRGFIIGGTESLLQTTNGGATWTGDFVGALGAKTFDRKLAYKYLTPGEEHTILLEAMDRLELPLRGYQAQLTLSLAPTQDSTITAPMTRCGYVDSIPCVP